LSEQTPPTPGPSHPSLQLSANGAPQDGDLVIRSSQLGLVLKVFTSVAMRKSGAKPDAYGDRESI
jgi:hypothetical protein